MMIGTRETNYPTEIVRHRDGEANKKKTHKFGWGQPVSVIYDGPIKNRQLLICLTEKCTLLSDTWNCVALICANK